MTFVRCLRIREDCAEPDDMTVDDDRLAEAIRAETFDIIALGLEGRRYVAVINDDGRLTGRQLTVYILGCTCRPTVLVGDVLIMREHWGRLLPLSDGDVDRLTAHIHPVNGRAKLIYPEMSA